MPLQRVGDVDLQPVQAGGKGSGITGRKPRSPRSVDGARCCASEEDRGPLRHCPE